MVVETERCHIYKADDDHQSACADLESQVLLVREAVRSVCCEICGRFEDAVSYYKNAENFKFFCLLGNIHDENDQQILEIKEIDSLMLDQLLEFSKDNDYNPFTSFYKEEGIITVSMPDPNDWMADEIHFYKESKDGAFSTSKAYTFILYEDKLCFLYQYDFTDEKSPVMLIRYVPTEIGDYFCSLLENLQNK